MLDRGVELSIKAANGTLSNSDKTAIQEEIDQLITEIDAIKERTKFNEVYVLKGDVAYSTKKVAGTVAKEGSLPAWVTSGGALAAGILSETHATTETYITTASMTATTTIYHSAASLDFSGFNSEAAKAQLIGQGLNSTCCTCDSFYSIEFTDKNYNETETNDVSRTYIYRIGIGDINMSDPDAVGILLDRIVDGTEHGSPNGHYTRFARDVNTLWIYDNRSKDSQSATEPTNFAEWDSWRPIDRRYSQTPNKSAGLGLFGDGVMREKPGYVKDKRHELMQDLALQVGAETAEFMHLKLPAISGYALGLDKLDVRKIGGAEESITAFGTAKDQVSADRSRLGAYQNRLEHTVKNLDNVVENTTAAESQIRDTDMATEMVRYSNLNVLTQAGQSMLTQANQSKQGILSLLSA